DPCPANSDFWYCPPGNDHVQYRCRDGVWATRACAGGCVRRPVGVDDTCLDAPSVSACPPRTDFWYCPPGEDHLQRRCRNGVWETRACPSGCERRPVGEDDVCLG